MTAPQIQQRTSPDILKVSFADIAAENDGAQRVGTMFEAHCRAIGLSPASDPGAAVIIGIDAPANGGLGTTIMRRRGILKPGKRVNRIFLKRPVTGGAYGLNVPSDANRFVIFDLFESEEQAVYSGGDGETRPVGGGTWIITGGTAPGGLVQLVGENVTRTWLRVRNISAGPVQVGPSAGGNAITLQIGEAIERAYVGAVFGSVGIANFEVEEL